jgi:hypothetical protein
MCLSASLKTFSLPKRQADFFFTSLQEGDLGCGQHIFDEDAVAGGGVID